MTHTSTKRGDRRESLLQVALELVHLVLRVVLRGAGARALAAVGVSHLSVPGSGHEAVCASQSRTLARCTSLIE